jgi:hypothetical protein
MLQGICAFLNNGLDYIFHRLIWYDWYAEMPINEILPGDESYQLLITPCHRRPWEHDPIQFLALLHQSTIQLKYPSVDAPLDIIPQYMAYILFHLFSAFDGLHMIGG